MADLTAIQDERLRRPAGIRSIRLGDTTVSYVPDGDVRLRPLQLLQDSTDEVWAAHPEYLDPEGHLVGSVGGLLVEHGGRALLIDAGFGPQEHAARTARSPRSAAVRWCAVWPNSVAVPRTSKPWPSPTSTPTTSAGPATPRPAARGRCSPTPST
nr:MULTISPECIES: hypothetical protein [unclassified Streptomyces]